MKKNENNIIIYQDEDGITKVSVKFSDEDIWLTQNQIVEIYKTTKQNISSHISNIYRDKELDMIIALGYRVQSQVATRFRIWATQRLHEYMQHQ